MVEPSNLRTGEGNAERIREEDRMWEEIAISYERFVNTV